MLCPNCRTEQSKRSGGCCPNCWIAVRIFTTKRGDKLWVRDGADAPPTALTKIWMREVSKRLTKEKGFKVNFTIHTMRQKPRWMREVAQAENLLQSVDYDMEIAEIAMIKAVEEAYRTPNTLAWVGDDFNMQAGIAISEREAGNKQTSADIMKAQLEDMEDVWD